MSRATKALATMVAGVFALTACGEDGGGSLGETSSAQDGDDGGSDDVSMADDTSADDTGDSGGGSDDEATDGTGAGQCGDNVLDDDEECDDGNTFDADGCDSMCRIESSDALPYNEAPFASTHNSYAGGDVGSIVEQLDAGVRFLEFDLHTDDYGTQGYTVGHDDPGDEVMLGRGNPDGIEMQAWLTAVAQWSDANAGHAPLTLLIDLKDRPSGRSYDEGNFAAFNAMVTVTLGTDRLYTPDALATVGGAWPTVAELADKVVVVLSGDEEGQLDYRRDRGDDPAIAINSLGQVVEVHVSHSDGDEMWLWTGQVEPDGSITWHRHNRYDTGNHPAVAINDDGLIVEVHEDPDFNDDKLWYRVGQLDADYEVQWATEDGQAFPGDDNGVSPGVEFISLSSDVVREVHQSQSSSQHWYWLGESVDTAAGTVDWARPDGNGETDDPLYEIATATLDGQDYEVTAGDDGPLSQVLTVHGATTERVRYRQLAFGSATPSSPEDFANDGILFFGANGTTAIGHAFIQQMNELGMVTRLWKFNESSDAVGPLNFPATDTPFADWYVHYCGVRVCAE